MEQPLTDETLNWRLERYEELTRNALYAALRARVAVFVVEQNCAYQDLDGMDDHAVHLSGWSNTGALIAYARLLPPATRFAEPSIGRVLTTEAGRGNGLGRPLMQRAIEGCRQYWPGRPIRMSAQRHLAAFYGSLGFDIDSDPYDEDGIPHVEMLLDR